MVLIVHTAVAIGAFSGKLLLLKTILVGASLLSKILIVNAFSKLPPLPSLV
jgi:hypothetical protein